MNFIYFIIVTISVQYGSRFNSIGFGGEGCVNSSANANQASISVFTNDTSFSVTGTQWQGYPNGDVFEPLTFNITTDFNNLLLQFSDWGHNVNFQIPFQTIMSQYLYDGGYNALTVTIEWNKVINNIILETPVSISYPYPIQLFNSLGCWADNKISLYDNNQNFLVSRLDNAWVERLLILFIDGEATVTLNTWANKEATCETIASNVTQCLFNKDYKNYLYLISFN